MKLVMKVLLMVVFSGVVMMILLMGMFCYSNLRNWWNNCVMMILFWLVCCFLCCSVLMNVFVCCWLISCWKFYWYCIKCDVGLRFWFNLICGWLLLFGVVLGNFFGCVLDCLGWESLVMIESVFSWCCVVFLLWLCICLCNVFGWICSVVVILLDVWCWVKRIYCVLLCNVFWVLVWCVCFFLLLVFLVLVCYSGVGYCVILVDGLVVIGGDIVCLWRILYWMLLDWWVVFLYVVVWIRMVLLVWNVLLLDIVLKIILWDWCLVFGWCWYWLFVSCGNCCCNLCLVFVVCVDWIDVVLFVVIFNWSVIWY